MRAIRSKDTAPEMVVRRLLHGMGYRYRLHRRDLPGKPDIVFGSRRKAIFVHGCFWHQHSGCREGRPPRSNAEYWEPKLARNRTRDEEHLQALTKLGWRVLVLWECEVTDLETLNNRLKAFLESGSVS